MLDAQNSAANTNLIYYMGPNEAAKEFIDPAILEDPTINPDQAIVDKLEELLDPRPERPRRVPEALAGAPRLSATQRGPAGRAGECAGTGEVVGGRRLVADRRAGSAGPDPRPGLVLPGAGWLVLFFVVPLAFIFIVSLGSRDELNRITLAHPQPRQLRAGVQPRSSCRRFLNSIRYAAITTVLSLAIGYPIAYWISRYGGRHKVLLLILVMLPFWTSYLIRTYSWIDPPARQRRRELAAPGGRADPRADHPA